MPRKPDPDSERRGKRTAPTRKPTSRRKSASKDEDPVAAEHRRLLEAQEELKRKQEKLQRLIKQAPAREAARKKKQREPIRINVSSAGHDAAGRSGVAEQVFGRARRAGPEAGAAGRADAAARAVPGALSDFAVDPVRDLAGHPVAGRRLRLPLERSAEGDQDLSSVKV